MGIQGLLPLLKSIMNPIHIKELEGSTVAIDTYSWLHKGALSCSTELCKGQPTSKHINYCMHRVNMLRHYGITPILVFDGGPLPMKTDQEIKRARSRKENLSRAMLHESNGNRSAAYECYQKAVDISPSVAYDLIQVLKQENVSYVVAPYEADAQMTFLALNKHVDAVITEDSDLIAFGCPRIIYKMDKFGQGVEFKNPMLQHNKELNFMGFSQMMLLEMCILSGCDYLQSLPGMGLKKAHTLMKKFKSHENVIKHLKYNSVEVTPLYEESFRKAIMTFRHQRVYDPVSEDIVHLSEPTGIIDEDLDFLGPSMPQHIAKGIAQGDLDPFTKEPIQSESDAAEKVLHGTYQLKNFKPDGARKKIDLPVQKNLLTNYSCFASLEAKREFRAPRIIPSQSNETSSPCINVNEVKHGSGTEDLHNLEGQDHGPSDEREMVAYAEIKSFTLLQNPVCKPCTSLDKDRHSDRQLGKATLVNENGIVRSTYFLKKSKGESKIDVDNKCVTKLEKVVSSHACEPLSALLEGKCQKNEKSVQSSLDKGHTLEIKKRKATSVNENGIVRSTYFLKKSKEECKIDVDNKCDTLLEKVVSSHACEPVYALLEGKCQKNEKTVAVQSSYFQQKNGENSNDDKENVFGKFSFQTSRFYLDAADCNTTIHNRINRVRSSYFEESSVNNSSEVPLSEDFLVRNMADEPCNYSILGSPSSTNSYGRTPEQRKIAQTDTPIIQANANASDVENINTEEEAKAEEGKFGCNISHLGRYSDIAEKSMEKFVSVISSFKYKSSGSRASGLRAPLKDVKNIHMKSSTVSMDLSNFAYAPTKLETSSRYNRTA